MRYCETIRDGALQSDYYDVVRKRVGAMKDRDEADPRAHKMSSLSKSV